MITIFRHVFGRPQLSPLWSDLAPVRDELFGTERLEHHARSLAAAQPVTRHPRVVLSLHARLKDNAAVLLAAYRASAAELEMDGSVAPAAEWLLDNYHLVEAQIREIRDDLPPGFYRQLPKLAEGPFVGYPRIFGMAWAFVAHTDSHFDPVTLRRFIDAYQQVQPLTIGELWAVAITLRIVLIENLRRLSDQITDDRTTRAAADALANRLLLATSARKALDDEIASRGTAVLSEVFAAELAKRLRDQDPLTTPALGWLEDKLGQQGTTIDQIVQRSQQRQGASNVSVRNVITSMRLISDIDWAELFESVSLVDARLRSGGTFATMDFPTRNLYRSAIEQLARGSAATELEVASAALAAASAAATSDLAQDERLGDPGYHLIGEGRLALERSIDFRPSPGLRLNRFSVQLGIGGYVGSILLVTTFLLTLGLQALSRDEVGAGWLALLALVAFLPITDLAATLVNRAVTWRFGAIQLPGLDLTAGVPRSMRTLVAVPTLLTNEADLLEQIERIEVHHLAGAGGDLTFALLTDGQDADQEILDSDARLLEVAIKAIARLNQHYGPAPGGSRFLILHRRRQFNPGEGRWMGWERKRGKLHELNRLLRGATDTSYMPLAGSTQQVPAEVRYVITLDADTRLPRDAAMRLIGKMAHPLNRPRFSLADQRVVNGYAILQPRVTPSLPTGREGSFYQRVFSSPGGMDPYAAAVSDVYQDLFGEGSYTGKGIYDIDAFEAALAGRVPENSMLSHDLFEGIFARAGLATDVEVVEEFPSRYDVSVKRQHRWTRGDWQLLPWIVGTRSGAQALPPIGRFKMLDNLRRSLLAPLSLLSLLLCWMLPQPSALIGTLLVLGSLAIPAFLPLCFTLLPTRSGVSARSHLNRLFGDLRVAASQTLLNLAFLPDQAWRMTDAIVRTLWRLYVTHRHLLEWTTAAQSAISPRLRLSGFYRGMAGGTALGLGFSLLALLQSPRSWPLVLPFCVLWLGAPALALWASRSPRKAHCQTLAEPDAEELRLIARRTWRFFETFVSEADNMLPPDNFQEDPKPVIAHRTSPTNMGLYLLSAVVARDFGWSGTLQTLTRLEQTLASMSRLQRHRGHFFNWYATEQMRVLEPAYVSAVDSGNLAGHLIAIANACEEWLVEPLAPYARQGLQDTLQLIRQAIAALPAAGGERGQLLRELLDEFAVQLGDAQALVTLSATLRQLAEKAARLGQDICPPSANDESADLHYWIDALGQTLAEHGRDLQLHGEAELGLQTRLRDLAHTARQMALDMDFTFLLDPERKLLSIGYELTHNSLDPSCYDLLASEARLASLFAIAKGDVTTRHWFRLGRTATPVGNGSALISWSGSMFEYLMPSLVIRAPAGSLLEQTSRLVVQRQQAYGKDRNVPWGISESAYNARDMEFTYQYASFGVPGLGLKRGLAENLVVAPYATALATMVDASGAQANFRRMANMGALGRYGFFEALDFTPTRLPDGQSFVIVRSYMAHHQAMTIVAIANTLQDSQMRARFHREPMIQACELLLHERMPRDVAIAQPRVEEVKIRAAEDGRGPQALRRIAGSAAVAPPVTHLLSNGRYAVMLTAAGAGYSRWQDLAVTRWREDASRDDYGSFIFLRDTEDGRVWPAGGQPLGSEAVSHEVIFGEDHAEFIRHDLDLTTTMDVLVSGEDDSEVRRVSLANSGRDARNIELTSYSEVVLTSPSVDNAHPAFAKLFVVTEYLPEFGALTATRRPRSQGESPIWAAHFAVVEGEVVADPQYETDRARFIGRHPSVAEATVITEGQPLSNSVGTVLDPIFSLKYRIRLAPGKVARVAFWTLVAGSRPELLSLIEKHHDRSAYDRAKTLAWTQAQVQLRYLDIKPTEAADFQRLAAPILYADPKFRAPSAAIIQGAGTQSGLWPHAISGDLPIVLLRIDDIQDIAQVRQLLRAHEYWRMKRLAVDLVILNEHASSYLQDLQIAIETAVRSSQSRPRFGAQLAMGSVYMLRADLLTTEARALLRSVARVSLIARRGPIANQLANQLSPPEPIPARFDTPRTRPVFPEPSVSGSELAQGLEFFNGLGGFDKDGREYVTLLESGSNTPAPWINVIANPHFGFQASAQGSGYTWAENSWENQITLWSNDPVTDPCGEAFYVRDEDSGALFTPTAQPIRDDGLYIARHGQGYSRFEHQTQGIALDLLQYVALADPIKISRLTLRNLSAAPRRLSVTSYTEWVLGTARGVSAPFIITQRDDSSGMLMARNPWSNAFHGRVSFVDLGGRQTAWTADRREFLGRLGSPATPIALLAGATLSGNLGAGLDPCAALQCSVELAAGESIEIVAFLGQCASVNKACALVKRYRQTDLDAVLQEVTDHWRGVLGSVQVKTPDRAMDIMLNGWLLYQTLACRIWARSAFYQASGAYGFRDQLQDGMALTFSQPAVTRGHILRAASRQFPEGDVQHWWLPHSGQGVRTRISDDRVWLAFVTATYIQVAGDPAILDEPVTFLEGPLLKPGEHDAFFQPMTAADSASLFEHCARGIDQCLELTGELGLPLIGGGDWNDGMNRVGEGGKGESVWLGWLLLRTIELFAPLADRRASIGDAQRAARWREHALALTAALEEKAWDGEWYRRATFDDGTWLGSKHSDECRIDSIAQSWAVLSGAAAPARARQAMASVQKHLIREGDSLVLLFTPPFDKTWKEPGYIKGYPPGVRENGGQYSHAAMWAMLAFAKLGDGNAACRMFTLLNPINHALTPKQSQRYKVEPYVVAADVYGVAPHNGRGGWTWYTGAAGWMHRAGMEGILGIRREGDWLFVDPCISSEWPAFEASITLGETRYAIRVENPTQGNRGIKQALLDDAPLDCAEGSVRLALDGGHHWVVLTL